MSVGVAVAVCMLGLLVVRVVDVPGCVPGWVVNGCVGGFGVGWERFGLV